MQTTDNLKSLLIKIWAHRPSIKDTKPLFIAIKSINIMTLSDKWKIEDTTFPLKIPVLCVSMFQK